MTDQAITDWELIEADYRSGIKTLRQIGAEHGVSHGAINKRAKRDGWTRDLAAKIKASAEAKLSKAVVPTLSKATEREIVEANADMQASIVMSHRADIRRNRALCVALLAELEGQTEHQEIFEQLGELMAKPDDRGTDKLNDVYRKVMSLPSRVDSMKKLAETLRILITIEREAFGVGTNTDDAASSIADAIRAARGQS